MHVHIARYFSLSLYRHPLLQSRALRLLRGLITLSAVQAEVSQLPSFRRGILAALESHNAAVLDDATYILCQAVMGAGSPSFAGDNLLRDALVCVAELMLLLSG